MAVAAPPHGCGRTQRQEGESPGAGDDAGRNKERLGRSQSSAVLKADVIYVGEVKRRWKPSQSEDHGMIFERGGWNLAVAAGWATVNDPIRYAAQVLRIGAKIAMIEKTKTCG